MTEQERTRMGLRIYDIRSQRRLSCKELSVRAGISEGHLHNIEHASKCPSLDAVVGIAQALDVSLDYLVLGIRPQFGDWWLVFRSADELKSIVLLD